MRTKYLIILGLSVGATLPTQAQLFTPEGFAGAGFGALTGALIAGPCHAGTGAAIGAGAGFLLGTIAHHEREHYYGPYRAGYYYYPGYYPSYYVTYNSAPTQPTMAAAQEPPAPFPTPPPPPSPMSGAN